MYRVYCSWPPNLDGIKVQDKEEKFHILEETFSGVSESLSTCV
jgi:hypothetical protein